MEYVEKFETEGKDLIVYLRKPSKKDIDKLSGLDVAKLNKIIRKEAKENKKHFEECGWDLDVDCITESVLYDLFGFHIKEFITASLISKDVHVKYGSNRTLFVKSSYEPVYFDIKKGKIVIGRVSKKNMISKRYSYLGAL